MTSCVPAWLLLIGAAPASVIAYLAWPGFMTFDSVFALEQARTGIVNGGYPPMISYLWRLMELAIPGQGGMFFLQLLAVCLACVSCVWVISRSWLAVIATACILPLLPVVTGPLLVVWKDVLFAGVAMLALLYCFWLSIGCVRSKKRIALAFCFLVFAASLRINGLPALVPGFYLLAMLLARSGSGLKVQSIRFLLCAAMSIFAAGLVLAISVWRLPDLQVVKSQSSYRYVMFHDMLGVSACLGVQVFSQSMTGGAEYTPSQLRRIYHPEHVQKSFGIGPYNLQEASLESITAHDWAREISNHPRCYVWHKLQLAEYMLGVNPGSVFYITDPSMYPNRFGLAGPDVNRVHPLLTNVTEHKASLLARPAVYLMAALFLGALYRWRAGRWGLPGVLLSGSALYFSASVLVYAAADLRYQYFEVLSAFAVSVGCFAWLVAEWTKGSKVA